MVDKSALEQQLGMAISDEEVEMWTFYCESTPGVYTINDLKTKVVGTSCGGRGREFVLSHPDVIAFLEEHSTGKFIFLVDDPNTIPYPVGTDIQVSYMLVWLDNDPCMFTELIERLEGSLYYSGDFDLKEQLFSFDSE